MSLVLLILIYCVPFIIYIDEFREDWRQWKQYRKDLKQAVSLEEKKHIKVIYWLNSGKF